MKAIQLPKLDVFRPSVEKLFCSCWTSRSAVVQNQVLVVAVVRIGMARLWKFQYFPYNTFTKLKNERFFSLKDINNLFMSTQALYFL